MFHEYNKAMKMEELVTYADQLFGIQLKSRQIQQLGLYERELQAWNEIMNLTAISDTDGIRSKHFLDSLSMALVLKSAKPRRLVDVGTGAGFPGLVIKILFPEIKLTLVESVGKKVQFCQSVSEKLNLSGVEVIKARAEEFGRDPDHRERYDCAVARAVANLPILAEYLLPLVSVEGIMVAQKGETGPAEAQKSEYAFDVLGGKLRKLIQVTLPCVVEERYLVVVDKIAPTPDIYPRRVGIPSKRPLTEK